MARVGERRIVPCLGRRGAVADLVGRSGRMGGRCSITGRMARACRRHPSASIRASGETMKAKANLCVVSGFCRSAPSAGLLQASFLLQDVVQLMDWPAPPLPLASPHVEGPPPLALLPTFECAARLGSFRRQRELHVTPSAVSQQIKALEEALGFVLFERLAVRFVISREGQECPARVRTRSRTWLPRRAGYGRDSHDVLRISTMDFVAYEV